MYFGPGAFEGPCGPVEQVEHLGHVGHDGHIEHDADDDNDDAEDHDYDEGAHDETYFNARKEWLEKNSPPVIDLTMLRGSDFSDDEKENDVPISLTIKVKVEAIEEEETQWTALDA